MSSLDEDVNGIIAAAIEDYCDKFDIKLIKNVVSRADFNGIEGVWSWAKREYKARLDW